MTHVFCQLWVIAYYPKMKVSHQKLYFAFLFVCLAVVTVNGQVFDDEVDEDWEDGNRDSRQAVPFAYVPPSKSCSRVSFGRSYCGGFSRGNGGGCDSYCLQQGYPLSYCRASYCLCHRGQDLGRECDQTNGK